MCTEKCVVQVHLVAMMASIAGKILRTQNALGGTMWAPININVLPSHSSHPSQITGFASPSLRRGPIDVPEPLDIAIDEYTAWQKSRASRDSFKEQMDITRNVALENCLNLRQITRIRTQNFSSTKV